MLPLKHGALGSNLYPTITPVGFCWANHILSASPNSQGCCEEDYKLRKWPQMVHIQHSLDCTLSIYTLTSSHSLPVVVSLCCLWDCKLFGAETCPMLCPLMVLYKKINNFPSFVRNKIHYFHWNANNLMGCFWLPRLGRLGGWVGEGWK